MRQYLEKLALAFLVGGCSLLYNPSNISKQPIDAAPKMDAPPPDVEMIADANPADLVLLDVFPTTIPEGAGTGGSRPAIFVLHGHNFVKGTAGNLMVSIAETADATVASDGFKIASDGDYIVVAVNVPVDGLCTTPTTKMLTVSVSENDGMGGTVTKSLPTGALSVECLPELNTAPTSSSLAPRYSQIALTTGITFAPTTAAAPAALLRAVGSITIGTGTAQPVDASASGAKPGPGGGVGGAKAAPGGGASPGQPGMSNSTAGLAGGNGGGGGLAMMGGSGAGSSGGAGGAAISDIWISDFSKVAGSGGGGGGNSALGAGGAGGAGGGTIELSAGGNLTVGSITANGGDASSGTGATPGGDGGAGTGGVVLLRAGGAVSVGTLTMNAGGLATTGDGGTSSVGRARVDAASGNVPANATVGPMVYMAPSVTTMYPTIMLHGAPNDSSATLKVFDKDGQLVANQFNMTSYAVGFGNTSPVATAAVMPALKVGYNKVCVIVAGGDPGRAESINCIEIGYAP